MVISSRTRIGQVLSSVLRKARVAAGLSSWVTRTNSQRVAWSMATKRYHGRESSTG
ncbi:hypothetical protein MARPU_01450 [Marichromatium purpuratum 984]|uniref:Uncharacterized protein n=1 Tax=Marichromatium purpuratum 984 TaxID=765910 RepID=W0E8H0_MARPU|nr:hypothetical protein MARPU_01450 [Marichromatium purpuratum 984]